MKTKLDQNERHGVHFRFTAEQYEYVQRLALLTPRGSQQKVISERVFPRRWKSELEELRAAQRKLGHRDAEFYPKAIIERMGLLYKPGRRRRKLLKAAA